MTPNELATSGVIRKDSICDGENSYTYILSRKDSSIVASFKIPLYSIRAEMTDSDGSQSYFEISDVFASESTAIKFFEKLVHNLATPVDLPYVLEDEIL